MRMLCAVCARVGVDLAAGGLMEAWLGTQGAGAAAACWPRCCRCRCRCRCPPPTCCCLVSCLRPQVWWGIIEDGQPPKQIIEGGEFFVLKRLPSSGGHH